MAVESRRAFVAQLTAGAGLLALGGATGCSPAGNQPAASAGGPLALAAAEPPLLEATLRGGVLALRYRYSRALGERFPGAPWAATLIVAVHPPSGSPACRRLAQGALRTEAPTLSGDTFHAAAEVELATFFDLHPPFVRYVHASFLYLRSDVVRVAT
ncbi:MAG: hypothetical protein ABJE95_29445 [Byssovorax sp.]